jgi:hypothetical protein
MFRISMTAALLILAIGQNSRLVCRVWCASEVGTSASCPHAQAASAGTLINATCDALEGEAAVFVRADRWRGPSALDPAPWLAVAALPSPPGVALQSHLILAAAPALSSAARPIVALRV